ncbi:MAG: dipeptide epimerase [Hyphomicrobiales bacterium]|nr:dipeptide epimerase [Hyphomicrobiales bacterium]MCP5001286.1 dipeptide epimerase [Hyphomicrobiales bacterium]
MSCTLTVAESVFPLAEVFTISRGSRTEARTVTVTLRDGKHAGHGEAVPYARYDETVAGVIEDISSLQAAIADGLSREELQDRLPGGAARNAVDCAMWDMEAKRAGKRAYELAGLVTPGPVQTAFTLSLEEPDLMRQKAERNAHRPLLKIKLGGEGDLTRVEAVRTGAPAAAIIVDANEGWTPEIYGEFAPELIRLGVKMVEQPLPAGADEALAEMERTLPVCADESCHDRASLPDMIGKYDMINIKLDKTGGLTEALALKQEALAAGLGIMVGCMVASSLAMAPAILLAQGADIVDLDGPLLLANDRPHPLLYDADGVHPSNSELWG